MFCLFSCLLFMHACLLPCLFHNSPVRLYIFLFAYLLTCLFPFVCLTPFLVTPLLSLLPFLSFRIAFLTYCLLCWHTFSLLLFFLLPPFFVAVACILPFSFNLAPSCLSVPRHPLLVYPPAFLSLFLTFHACLMLSPFVSLSFCLSVFLFLRFCVPCPFRCPDYTLLSLISLLAIVQHKQAGTANELTPHYQVTGPWRVVIHDLRRSIA